MCVWLAADVWDHAAPWIIVEEAGGRFSDHSGGKRLDRRSVAAIDDRRVAGNALVGSNCRRQASIVEPADVTRAIDAATSIAVAVGLPADHAIVVQDSNKLALRLLRCDVFARVSPPGHEHAAFEVELAQRLAQTESPVAALELRRAIRDHGAMEQLLHGEPHPGNVLRTANGPVFVDFETCCRGPVEFDLAHVPDTVSEHYPGVDLVLLRDCRQLVLAMVAMALGPGRSISERHGIWSKAP